MLTVCILPREGGSIHEQMQTPWQRVPGSHDPVLTHPVRGWKPVEPVFESVKHWESLRLLWDCLCLFDFSGTAQLWLGSTM